VSFVVLVSALAFVLGACGRDVAVAPRDDQGKPLDANDPDRYLPPKLERVKVGKLAPLKRQEIADQTATYGLGGWVTDYVGATANLSLSDPSRAFVNIVRTDGPDAELAPRVAFYGSGSGTIEDLRDVDIDGEAVRVGAVVNAEGRFPFAVWSPTADTTVAVTIRGSVDNIGMDPETSMRQIIEWSKA
jgi:hypothetical protein